MIKKVYTLVAALGLTLSIFAQSPEKMSYQAVIRNAGNTLVMNQTVGMQISILQGSIAGTPVYVETQTATTNLNGLVSIEIGNGTVVSGNMNTIDWSTGIYFIKTETDPTGGTSYSITGTSQLLSVPFALHATTADSIAGGVSITETDPVFVASIAVGITSLDTANWNNQIVDTQIDSLGVANFGYVAGPKTIDTQLDSIGVSILGFVAGAHTIDTDTQLDSLGIANLGYVAGAKTVDTDTQLDSIGISTFGFVAGAHTIDTQLDSSEIALLGYVAGPKTIDTDTQLDSAAVAALGYVAGAKTVNTDTQLDSIGIANLGYVAGPKTIDTDTQLDEVAVDGFVANNGFLTSEIDGSVTNEIQALSMSNDTVYLSNGGFVKLPATFDGNYSSLTGAPTKVSAFTNDANYLTSFTEMDSSVTNEIELPTGGASGQVLRTDGSGNYTWVNQISDTDTDTQLTEAQVDGFVANNGYLTSFTEMDSSVTNEIELPVGGSNGQVLKTDGSGNYAWVNQTVDTDTQLSETQVDAFVANNGYLTSFTEMDSSVTNEIELPVGGSNGQVLKTDGSGNYAWVNQTVDTDWQEAGTNISRLNGNVGIGFATPPNKLYVLDNKPAVMTIKNSTVGEAAFTQWYNSDESTRGILGVDGVGYTGTPNQLVLGTWTKSSMEFRTNQVSRILIDTIGRVGINTIAPTAQLHIIGGVRIENGTEGLGKVLTSDANGNVTWGSQIVDTDTQLDSTSIAALGFVAGEHSNALVYKGAARAKNLGSPNPNVDNEIPTGASTIVRWKSVAENYSSSIGGTNNTEITVPAGITYIRINTVILFDQILTTTEGKAQYIVYKNGSPFTGLSNSGYMTYQYFNYAYSHNYHSTLIPVTAGDVFDIRLFQNSGASLYLNWGSISSAVSFEFYSN